MKKVFAAFLVVVMMLSLCACDASDYKKAMAAYDKGDYKTARELFEDLGDYKDSADMAEKSLLKEIDDLLQGDWEVKSGSITQTYEFDDGRFTAGMSIGTASIDNEGTYRIDTDSKEIYVCYDYIISSSGKKPNTEEKLLFTYTYSGSNFVLKNSSGDTVDKD